MAAWVNSCRYRPTLGGTTDWTFSAAVLGYNSPALAGIVNARVYKYRAESDDLSQWEEGEGTYTTSTGVLTRTTVLYNSAGTGTAAGQSGAGTKINFTTAPQVAIVALKEDLISIEEANVFTSTQSDQARKNILAAGVVRVQKFTASGTYTPDANMLYCIIECLGGGGGGGGAAGSVGGIFSGCGGGSGVRSILYASRATVGASQTVTIGAAGTAGAAGANAGGAGGTTSVGAICSANGGAAGGGGSGGVGPTGAPGQTVGTGDIVIPGGFSAPGVYSNGSTIARSGGEGSSSIYGTGGLANLSLGSAAGNAAQGNGAGGGAGLAANTASTFAGAVGTAGLVVITEYCSA